MSRRRRNLRVVMMKPRHRLMSWLESHQDQYDPNGVRDVRVPLKLLAEALPQYAGDPDTLGYLRIRHKRIYERLWEGRWSGWREVMPWDAPDEVK